MSVKKIDASSRDMMRTVRLVRLLARKMGFDENIANVNWKKMRFFADIGYKFMPKEKNVSFCKTKIGSINAIECVPDELRSNRILLHIHGGGFVSGSASASKGYCSMAARYFGSRVFTIDYPLAPENPYPYAVDNCFEAYRILTEENPDSDIILAGESAGGNLCLVTALRAAEEHLKKPVCLMLHSPVVDFSGILKRENEIKDIFVKPGSLKPLNAMYAGENDTKNYKLSPIYGDFTGFPPLIISCDENETLLADSLALYEKAIENNVDARLYRFKNTFHAAGILGTNAPETKALLEDSVALVESLA